MTSRRRRRSRRLSKYVLVDRLSGIEIRVNSENTLEKLLTLKFHRVSGSTYVLRREKRKRRHKRGR